MRKNVYKISNCFFLPQTKLELTFAKLQVEWNDINGGYGKHFFEYNHAGDQDVYFPLQSGAPAKTDPLFLGRTRRL